MGEQEHITGTSAHESPNEQTDEKQASQLSQNINKYGKKISFFASVFTIIGSLVSILTLAVSICTLNTATSIVNAINTTINNNQIIQVGDIGIIQHGDNSTLTVSIENAPKYEMVDYKFGTEEETRLLSLAKRYFDAEDYQTAFSIYSSEELSGNDYATINRAYCYAHGYGVKADVEMAMELYTSVDLDDAKRNQLALMLATNSQGNYDSKIEETLTYFDSIDDYYVLNYLSLCKYGKSIELVPDKHFEVELSELYHYEFVNQKYYTTAVAAGQNGFYKYVYEGAVTGSGSNGLKGIYYVYNIYRLQYLDWLEQLFG